MFFTPNKLVGTLANGKFGCTLFVESIGRLRVIETRYRALTMHLHVLRYIVSSAPSVIDREILKTSN